MYKMKLYFKSVAYSYKLIYQSSKLMILVYFLLNLIFASAPLANTYILKTLFDILTVKEPNIQRIILYIIIYVSLQIITDHFTNFRISSSHFV